MCERLRAGRAVLCVLLRLGARPTAPRRDARPHAPLPAGLSAVLYSLRVLEIVRGCLYWVNVGVTQGVALLGWRRLGRACAACLACSDHGALTVFSSRRPSMFRRRAGTWLCVRRGRLERAAEMRPPLTLR